MCGRFTNEMTWPELHALYSIHDEQPAKTNSQPRFNIAPTQDVDFAHLDEAGNIELDRGRWWLVPFWAKEVPKATLFNARIENAANFAADHMADNGISAGAFSNIEADNGPDPLPEGSAKIAGAMALFMALHDRSE